MSTRTLDRTTFTPTNDPSVWYAGSRSRPGIQYRIERVGHPDMWCACPATKRCAHLNELAELLAAATPAKDDWNDIAPLRAAEKEAPLNAPESPTALTVIERNAYGGVVTVRANDAALAAQLHDPTKQAILRNTLTTDLTQPEFDLFIEVCAATGLNPFMRQIHAIKRGTGDRGKMTIQTGIDGYRLIAQRTGQYDGQDGPFWCGEDGVWKDVWLTDEPPVASKVVTYRKDTGRGFTGIARFAEYAQWTDEWVNGKKTGRQVLNSMWAKMPTGQLAKCASALSLRMAFPAEMSGVYTEDEMAQADNSPALRLRADISEPSGEGAIDAYAQEDRDPREIWPWLDQYEAERKAAGMKHGGVAEFLKTPIDTLYVAIDDYLKAKSATPKVLVSAVADWLAAGKPKAAPVTAEPATEPAMFDEAEYTEVPA